MTRPHTPAWILTGQEGPSSLQFVDSLELPQLGDHDVLVKIHAASLNYREVVIAQVPHPSPPQHPVLTTTGETRPGYQG